MPTGAKGSAAYKKKDGTLVLAKDNMALSWTPVAPPGAKPALVMPVSSISNLQQTPASSAKVMLKVFVQEAVNASPETHVFAFTSATVARAEADAIRDALGKAIQESKAAGASGSAGTKNGGGTSAAMAMASAVSAKTTTDDDLDALYDDEKLQADSELQQSLLKANGQLSRTFVESLRTKPDTTTSSQFTRQFWSTRTHLLRAHAIERRQTRGSYNVLSTIRPVIVDNVTKLSISKEQIQLIFGQHPLVKRVYDESVPKLSEEAFWSRFFQSKLFKKLKGERTSDADAPDGVLDKYLHVDEDEDRARRVLAAHVPHIIDVEGNEENHSQRKGNAPDRTMRPTSIDKVPIIRSLNALSEKILSKVRPNDVDPSQPIGVDEETFNALALRDLQGDAEENKIVLNIKDQARFVASDDAAMISEDAANFAKHDPTAVLNTLRADLANIDPSRDLGSLMTPKNHEHSNGNHMNSEAIDDDDDDDESDDDNINDEGGHEERKGDTITKKHRRIGSKAALSAATGQIFKQISEHRLQLDDDAVGGDLASTSFSTVQSVSTRGLSQATFDRLTLTHATTTEFLQYFWTAFLSSSTNRTEETGRLIETLDRAMSRIEAVAVDAEHERQQEIERLQAQLAEYVQRTGKKRKVDFDSVPGGRKVVEQLLQPTTKAIQVAGTEYARILESLSQSQKES